MKKINKLCLYGYAGIMLIGFASGAVVCPSFESTMDLGSNKNYDNCNIYADRMIIGHNNSFKNAVLNATEIDVEGANNNFTNAKLKATDLDDYDKTQNPDKYCTSGWKPYFDYGQICDDCPSTATQIWTGATYNGTVTNYTPAPGLVINPDVDIRKECYKDPQQ